MVVYVFESLSLHSLFRFDPLVTATGTSTTMVQRVWRSVLLQSDVAGQIVRKVSPAGFRVTPNWTAYTTVLTFYASRRRGRDTFSGT